MSFAFNEAYYLKSKLAQLQADDAATYGSWTTAQVKQAIEDAGMTVEGHYQQYSLVEGTSANPYFNTTEYLEAKLAQLKSIDPAQYNNWTVDDVVKAFQDAGLTAEEHYQMYGCKETDANGYLINPSNAFDANAYVQAKLAQLVASDPETYGEWTAEDVVEAIADAGMTPVDHYEEYGKAEGEDANIAMLQTVPVTQRVANDELRDATGENVPSNYNKPVDAPKDVTAAEAAENGGVDKPCDMADSSTVKPEEPVATPADSDYVAVPGGGIADTNENPVELVTAEVKDTDGNTVASASEYGVASTTKDANGNTVKTVQPVDSTGAVDADADPIQTVTTSEDGKTQTTETKVTDAQGNCVEVAEKVTTADDGSTVTDTVATAKDADGNQTAKTETRVAADADGEVTGTNTTYTDANGETSTDSTGEDPGTPENPETPDEPDTPETPASTATTFSLSLDNNVLSFAGTATGAVTLTDDGSTITATRAGLTANVSGQLSALTDIELGGATVDIASNKTTTVTASSANGATITGEGNVTVTGSEGAQTLTVQTTGASGNGITAGTGADKITLGDEAVADKLTVKAGTAPVAQVSTVTLENTWEPGDTVTVSGIGTSVTYTATDSDADADAVAANLASAINDDANSLVIAAASGNGGALTLTAKTAGESFTATATAADGGANSPAVKQVVEVTLKGTFANGDVITATNVASKAVTVDIDSNELAGDISAIATKLAEAINKADGATVTATPDGTKVTLESIDAGVVAKEAGVTVTDSSSTDKTKDNVEAKKTVEGAEAVVSDKSQAVAVDNTTTASVAAGESDSTPTDYDVVTNFDTTNDKLILKDSSDSAVTQAMTATNAQVTAVKNGVVTFAAEITDLADKIEAVFTAMGTDKHVAVFEHTENETTSTYVLLGDGAAGQSAADVVVELVGVADVANITDVVAAS